MSRIFDSLRKAGGKAADVALPLIDKSEAAKLPAASGEDVSDARVSTSAAEPAAPQVRVVSARPLSNLPVLPFDGTHPASAEQYRIIRTKIIQHTLQPRVVAISSPGAGDGKTISALNIAGAMSLKGEVKVLLVEADLRRSSFCRLLQLPDEPGLIDVLSRKCTLEDALMKVEQLPNLYLLPSGAFRPDASELLDSPFGRAIFQTIRKRFHYVILDSPPIGSIADYDVIQAAADGVLVVLRPDHTKRRAAMDILASVPKDKMLGVVMNNVRPWFFWRSSHPSYYYTEPGSDAS